MSDPGVEVRSESGDSTGAALEVIYGRRSVRSYLPQPIEEATLRTLLRAVVQAPSAMNAQPWAFAIVQDAKRLQRYSERAKALLLSQLGARAADERYAALLSSPGFNIFYEPE